ncbi:MAG: 2OG-Fe(II) oxygenase [Gammaproteobacteria bacterium]|nr:2OG-Fe(II) oxygenase [Gammaproteobacteria bacterium]
MTDNTTFLELFDGIAEALADTGLVTVPNALPQHHCEALRQCFDHAGASFHPAAIGRQQAVQHQRSVRGDEIRWIADDAQPGPAERAWLDFTEQLRRHLNQRLFLGLFSYESHFAHYAPGTCYQRHMDAFAGDANRILSTVLYLNAQWGAEDGGELVIYPARDATQPVARITPAAGTLVVFLSERFPHEVLSSHKDRYSIAGWYRRNTSSAVRSDPPR